MSKLTKLREKKKMSVEELALKSDTSLQVIKRIEDECTEPTLAEAERIAKALKVEIKDILNKKTPKKIMTMQLYDEIIRVLVLAGIILSIINYSLWAAIFFIIIIPTIIYIVKYIDIKKEFKVKNYDIKSDIAYIFIPRIVLNTAQTKEGKHERKFYYRVTSLIYSSITTLVATLFLTDTGIVDYLKPSIMMIYIVVIFVLMFLVTYFINSIMFERVSKSSNKKLKK